MAAYTTYVASAFGLIQFKLNKMGKRKIKEGDFVQFAGMEMKIRGYICKINDDGSTDYIRDSMIRWTGDSASILKGFVIGEEKFINSVIEKTKKSILNVPSEEQVRAALLLYKQDYNVDRLEIYKALGI